MHPLLYVLLAYALTLLTKLPVSLAMARQGGYDNHNPRLQQAQLTGWGKRSVAAHQNAFEAFPAFAIAVVVAWLGEAEPRVFHGLAAGFLLLRVAYQCAYLADAAMLRSIVWISGAACCAALMLTPAF
ncbi:MAG: MAPEG family protein [Myxococcota bacterium]|nr:MAPEG family protein [Myxococcota bacterium]